MPIPRAARWWLRLLVRAQNRQFFLGDLAEEFAAHVEANGERAARAWYWRQTLHSSLPLIRQRLQRRDTFNDSTSGDPMWRDLLSDLQYTLRLSRRNPLASTTVVLTMVLGIGITTAVFSVVNSVLLKPLPFIGANRTVELGLVLRDGHSIPIMSIPLLQDYRRDAVAFSGFAAATSRQFTFTQGDTPVQLSGAMVDEGYQHAFDIHLFAGQYFGKETFQFGGPAVVLLSHAFWKRQFASDPGIIGKVISLDNEPRTVLGVLAPTTYSYPESGIDLMVPLIIKPGSPQANRTAFWLSAVGTIKPGLSIEQARSDIALMNKRIAAALPERGFDNIKISITPLQETLVGNVRPMLSLLAASVAAVLLIVCVNMANLLLGRSHARAREFVVRAALGASRGRLGRQLLSESLMLSSIGGIVGIAVAPLVAHGLVALYPGGLPRAEEIGVDARVVAFAIVITLLAGILAGIPMARRAVGMNLSRDLRSSGRLAGSASQRWIGTTLIVSQVAMSVTLLFVGGLLLRTFSKLANIDPGFQASAVTSFYVFPSKARHPTDDAVTRYYNALEDSLSHIPGVRSVTTAVSVPLDDDHTSRNPFIDKRRGNHPGQNPSVLTTRVGERFFTTLGMPIVAGRDFSANDDAHSPKVVIINETLAKQQYPNEDPVGRVIEWNGADWEIIGVVGAVRSSSLWEAPLPEFYATNKQDVERGRYVVLKASIPVAPLLSQVRAALSTIDPTIALTNVTTMSARLSSVLAPQRFRAALVGGLGMLALVLSTLGIYGVVASAVGRQTREIGIRMALGEAAGGVQRRVVLASLQTALFGAVVGMIGALLAGRLITNLLFGVSARDWPALLLVSVLLLMVAALAAYVPARRASQVDPVVALRSDS